MKIIDKTPLIDEKGSLGPLQRVQGMLQFGFNWPNELQVQNAIIKFFGSQLEKGYTLIRNMPLGESGIMVPIILLGPTGIYVIEITSLLSCPGNPQRSISKQLSCAVEVKLDVSRLSLAYFV